MSKAWLEKFIGVPFVDGGRELRGCDCWGLVMLVFAEYGVSLPDYRISCFQSAAIHAQIERARVEWRRLPEPAEPSLVVFKSTNPKARQGMTDHLGVYVGGGMMLHTLIKQQAHLDRISHPFWARKIEGFYEYVGR